MTAARFTVVAPLRVEAWALRRPPAGTVVMRGGMGPARAARVGRLLSGRGGADSHLDPVAVAGLGGGLTADLAPGDVVVASEVRGCGPPRVLPSAPLVLAALRRAGIEARIGPVVSSEHVVTGAQRHRLAATGALAVDMESAAIAAATTGYPLAVLRVVVDSPHHRLASPRVAGRAWRALAALRASLPALQSWAAAAGSHRVVLAAPRSFCAGVDRAIDVVERAIDRFGAPVFVRRQIVHNLHVVQDLERRGAVFVDEVEEVPDGATLVLAAHGVSPAVRDAAVARAGRVIDATCPLVHKVHREARRFGRRGYRIVLIGHRDHEEVEGTLGEAAGITVVAGPEDVERLEPDGRSVAYLTQTTLAVDEATATVAALHRRFPDAVGPQAEDICYATQNRQDAVRAIARHCDVVLVVGSRNSSNSNRLVEVASREGCRAHLLDDATGLDPAWLAGASTIGLTAGASAPESAVQGVVAALGGLGPLEVEERQVTTETVSFRLPPEVR